MTLWIWSESWNKTQIKATTFEIHSGGRVKRNERLESYCKILKEKMVSQQPYK